MNHTSGHNAGPSLKSRQPSSTKVQSKLSKRKLTKKPLKKLAKPITTLKTPLSQSAPALSTQISSSNIHTVAISAHNALSQSSPPSFIGFAPSTFIKPSKPHLTFRIHHNTHTIPHKSHHKLISTINIKTPSPSPILTSTQRLIHLRTALSLSSKKPRSITPLRHTSKRTFVNQLKQLIGTLSDTALNVFKFARNFANPFQSKRTSHRIQLEGKTDLMQKFKMIGMVIGVGVLAYASIVVLFKFAVLAIKIGIVAFIINKIRNLLIGRAVQNGDLDLALLYETWGESHANSNGPMKFVWMANPISWFRKLQSLLSIQRRKHARCQEIANDVIQGLQSDPRMVTMFGNDFVIGYMDTEVGTAGLDEEEMYDGFITLRIYSNTPQIIDVTADADADHKSKQKRKKRQSVTQYSQQFLDANRAEIGRRLRERYGANSTSIQEMEVINELIEEKIGEIDPNDDDDYDYKFFRQPPKWRMDMLDPETKEEMEDSKRQTFFAHPDLTDRINILDFEAAAHNWEAQKWRFRADNATPEEITTPTSKQLTEVGMIYAFFSIPALETPLEQNESGRIKVDAINILTGGTKQPFELEKVFAVGDNVERFTLYQKGLANWSKNNRITKDRTMATYDREKREELEKEQEAHKQAKRAARRQKDKNGGVDDAAFMSAAQAATTTRTVGVSNDDKRIPIVEAELVTESTSTSNPFEEKPIFHEAEIVVEPPKPKNQPSSSKFFNDDVGAR